MLIRASTLNMLNPVCTISDMTVQRDENYIELFVAYLHKEYGQTDLHLITRNQINYSYFSCVISKTITLLQLLNQLNHFNYNAITDALCGTVYSQVYSVFNYRAFVLLNLDLW